MHSSGIKRARTSRISLRVVLVGLGMIAVILAGIWTPTSELPMPELVAAIFAVLLIALRPELGMLAVAAALPIENIVVVGGEMTGVRLLGTFVAFIWLLRKLLVLREPLRPLFSSNIFKAMLPLLLLATISASWAGEPSSTYDGVLQLGRMLLWCLLVTDLANSWERIDWLAKAFTVGAIIAAALTLQQFNAIEGRAGSDIAGGINNTAMELMMNMPFAFYLVRSQNQGLWRAAGFVYIIAAALAISVTFSRTSFLLLPLIILINYWDEIRRRSRLLTLIVLAIVLVAAAISVLPREMILDRIQTIGPYMQATFAAEDETTSARGYHWRVGLAMFTDHPVFGVGFRNHKYNFGYYKLIVPGAPAAFGNRRSPHSNYIGFLAELGVTGLTLWLILLLAALYNVYIAWSKTAKVDKSSNHFLLIQAITYGLLLEIAYGWSAQVELSKTIWLIFGLSYSIRCLVEQTGAPLSTPT